MKIAYLVSMYPDVSHTFIVREVKALRDRGVSVSTFSVRRPTRRNVLGEDAHREADATRALLPPPIGSLLAAFAWVLATRPLLTVRTLLQAVTGRGMTLGLRFKWLCYFGEAVLLAHWLARDEIGHLHCHFGNSGSSTGMLAARLARVPFSVTCHGSELLEIQEQRLPEKVARAAFVACVSYYGKAQLMRACDPELWGKLHIVRCGVTPVEVVPGRGVGGPARILCVGRFSPEKGHLVLLDALAELRDRGNDFRCTLVGDGPLRTAAETRAQRLGLTDALTFTGSLEPERVAQLYQLASVVVLASFSEGVPVVLMEAMARGLPVVATHVGGVPELIRDGHSGLLVAPGDSQALAEAMQRVLADPDRAATLGRNGAQTVRDKFNSAASARRIAALFHSARRSRVSSEAGAEPECEPCSASLTPQDS